MVNIVSFGKSDIGLKRSNNEDVFVVRQELGLLAVADGMGGAASGEIASRIFADTIIEFFSQVNRRSEQDTFELVQRAFQLANERILNLARNKQNHEGMGCTAEVIVFDNKKFVLGHVGDSRTYLFRQGNLRQMTRDHSLVQDQLDEGLITEDEARSHSHRNVILRAVGIEETLAVDFIRGESKPGDIFLLCSDGLTDLVDDNFIRDALTLPLDLPERVDKLLELAKSAGGNDNITVILCEVMDS